MNNSSNILQDAICDDVVSNNGSKYVDGEIQINDEWYKVELVKRLLSLEWEINDIYPVNDPNASFPEELVSGILSQIMIHPSFRLKLTAN